MLKRSYLFTILLLFGSNTAFSVVNLKDVKIIDSSSIKLSFDSSLIEGQYSVDAFDSTLQITLRDMSVYPAIVRRGESEKISKVFAYQYTPNVVRVRVSTEGKSEAIKASAKVSISGKTMSISMTPGKSIVQNSKKSSKEVLKEIEKIDQESNLNLSQEDRSSPFKGLWITLILISAMVVVLWLFKGMRNKRMRGMKGFKPGFGRFIQGLGIQGDAGTGKWIEILSQTYLGPKKSLAVVKVKDRTLLVGITEEQINLISEFDEDDSTETASSTFEEEFQKKSERNSNEWKSLIRDRVQNL